METHRFFSGILLCTCLNVSASAELPDVWNVRSAPTTNQLNGVTYGNGLFVAVGNHNTILTSWNG
ncbi:MAG: hypothetical protein ACTHKU_09535, partial [Verrucomicrobiota bacterium]